MAGRTLPSRDVATVAGWTLVSRITGLGRIVATGAVLGPTFFANVFQISNTVPNQAYTLVAGSILASIVVPALVRELGSDDPHSARRLAGGLSGIILAGSAIATVALLALSPILATLITASVDAADRSDARGQAILLLVLVAPQLLFYAIAALGGAAQQSQRHFRLPAAAPALENIGLIVTLLLAAERYGTGMEVGEVPLGLVVLLGAGSTLSVATHAGIQLFGAHRCGLPLIPRAGWRDSQARTVARRLLASVSTAALPSLSFFGLLIAAGTIPGGAVAFQVAYLFYNLPQALGARAVSTTTLPRLAKTAAVADLRGFARTFRDGMRTTWILSVPATLVVAVLGTPIATVIAFGELDTPAGVRLIAACIDILALAQLAAATAELARQGAFALVDVRGPLRAAALAALATAIGIAISLSAFHGIGRLGALALTVVVADLVAAVWLVRRLHDSLPGHSLMPWAGLMRTCIAAAAMLPPLLLVGRIGVDTVDGGRAVTAILLAVAGVAALAAYIAALHVLSRRPEPATLTPAFFDRLPFSSRETLVVAAGSALALLFGAAAGLGYGLLLVGAMLGIAFFAVVAWRPIIGTYAYLATMPFITGVERDRFVPFVRINELLLVVCVSAAVLGGYVRWINGKPLHPRLHRLDAPLIAMCAAASVWPLTWLLLRGHWPDGSDVFSTLPLLKLAGLALLVRVTVRDEAQLRRCLWAILLSSAGLAIVATLQTVRFPPIVSMLDAFFTPSAEDGAATDRGSSTLASSIAVGDVLTYTLALVAGLAVRGWDRAGRLFAIGALCVVGSLASGQFSSWISLVIAGVLLLVLEPRLRALAWRFAPIGALIGALVSGPVVASRFQEFDDGFGMPSSWVGRWDNVTTFYLPQLRGLHLLFGVGPDTVLPAPETWREIIYLESGYVWFIFVGGLPLLLAYLWFTTAGVRHARRVSRADTQIGAVGLAFEVALWVIALLSIIDMHITLRGGGDLLFVFFGLLTGSLVATRTVPDLASGRERALEAIR